MLLRAIIVSFLALPFAATSQVHSLALGIDVNSPYGLSEPWYTVRHALLRCEEIETVAERPDLKTGTATITPKGGKLPDLAKLEKAVAESGAGATLRGIEVIAEGELIYEAGKLSLRLPQKEVPLRPITNLVQQERKRPRPATAEELNAYGSLVQQAHQAKRWQVTGPVRWMPELVLEVRAFRRAKN